MKKFQVWILYGISNSSYSSYLTLIKDIFSRKFRSFKSEKEFFLDKNPLIQGAVSEAYNSTGARIPMLNDLKVMTNECPGGGSFYLSG